MKPNTVLRTARGSWQSKEPAFKSPGNLAWQENAWHPRRSSLTVLFSLMGSLLLAQSKTWYFSASRGNDNNSGLSPAAPLKSLRRLQDLLWGAAHQGARLSRGDTIAFLRGDTFRVPFAGYNNQPVWHLHLATPLLRQRGAPVVLTAYGPGTDRPVFAASWKLSELQGIVVSTSPIIKVYKPMAPWDTLTVFRVFYRGKPLILAREPEWSEPWDVVASMWLIDSTRARSESDPDTLYSAAIAGLSSSFFEGATLWASSSGYSWLYTRPILSKGSNELIVLPRIGKELFRGNRFYVENKLAYLDTPGEWYYDDATDTLYIYPPSGSFSLSDYEVTITQARGMRGPLIPYGMTMTTNYDTIPDDPAQNIIIQGIAFAYFPYDAVRSAGSKQIILDNCHFYENFIGFWNFLAEDLYFRNNTFRNTEACGVRIYGRTPDGVSPGHPKTLSRRVWVEKNDIRYTGLGPRWTHVTLRDTVWGFQEDCGIQVGYGLDSVFVRGNRIDSVSQGGIYGGLYHWSQTAWYQNYPGTLPYVIENNHITNFCMDFSDCGGIKVGFVNRGAIIRNNILDAGRNRDKRHQADFRFMLSHEGGAGLGLYTDVHQEGLIFTGNTVIGPDVGIANYGGEWNVRNIHMEKNTIYNPVTIGIDLTMGATFTAENCTARENLIFSARPGHGLVYMYDGDRPGATNGINDSLQELNNNRYFAPNYTASYWRRRIGGALDVYGYQNIQQLTSYERGPRSYWGWWARYRWHWWDSALVKKPLTTNPTLNVANVNDLPFARFGDARVQLVTDAPGGGRAVLVYCPSSSTRWSGIGLKLTEPLFADTLSPFGVYRFRMVYTANRQTDFPMAVPFWTWHPVTGDSLWNVDHFALPVREALVWDSIVLRYEPRLYQRRSRPEITLRPGDSLWIRYFAWDEIDPASVQPLSWYYPIYYNPSDVPQTFSLPAGQVYLTTDSQLVHTSITIPPWQSRILIWVGTSPSGALENFSGIVSPTALIYPNPATDYVKVLAGELGEYELYTLTGQLVQRGVLVGDGAENVVSLQDAAPGVYLLQLRHRSGIERAYRIIRVGYDAR